jgi:hypothetical protein
MEELQIYIDEERQYGIRQQIVDILTKYYAPESRKVAPNGYSERLGEMAALCFEHYDGDVVEIGALNGATTVHLLRAAKAAGRRVLVVDPWQTGVSSCRANTYPRFLKNTEPYKEYLDVLRDRSQSEEAIQWLGEHELAFAIVDGLHEPKPCYSDILAVAHAPVIAVDDIRCFARVRRGFDRAVAELGRDTIVQCHNGIREGYIVS